jgi:anaphase-promoting complex subunit 4
MHLVTIPLDPFPRLEPKRQIRLDPAKAADGARPNWEEVSEDLVVQLELLNPDREAWCIRHLFGDQHDSEPAVLAVNGRLGRRAVCVLDSDGLRYSVLDMDRRRDESDDEEEAALSA